MTSHLVLWVVHYLVCCTLEQALDCCCSCHQALGEAHQQLQQCGQALAVARHNAAAAGCPCCCCCSTLLLLHHPTLPSVHRLLLQALHHHAQTQSCCCYAACCKSCLLGAVVSVLMLWLLLAPQYTGQSRLDLSAACEWHHSLVGLLIQLLLHQPADH
jgi:hypothetical protein